MGLAVRNQLWWMLAFYHLCVNSIELRNCGRLTRTNRDLYILICTKESPCLFVTAPESRQADSQGTSSVLYGDELKPELSGLSAEPKLRASQSFFIAAVKHTLVVRFLGAKQVVNNSSQFVSRGGDSLGFAELPSDPPKELAEIIFCMMQRVGRHS
jgi:hypothetical protein